MAFNLGGFAQGLDPALQALAGKIHDGELAKIQLNGLIQGGGNGTPINPGQSPAPGGGGAAPAPPQMQGAPQAQTAPPAAPSGAPAPVPMPGATPMPQAQAAPPAAPGGVAPMQGLPGPQQPPAVPGGMSGASSGAPGGQQPPGASPEQGPAMSGVAQPSGNEFQDSQKTLRSILMDLKQRNPHARPAQILEAAQQQITMMKGLNPETSALLRAQTASMAIEQRYQADADKMQTAHDALVASLAKTQELLDAKQKALDELIKAKHEDVQTQVQGGVKRAEIGAAGGVRRAEIGAAGGIERARVTQGDEGGGARSNLKLERQIDGTVVGKDYHTVTTQAQKIKALANDPGITNDPAAQQGMIDSFVRMMTARGVTKAQYDQFAKHMGFRDWASVTENLASGHPIIGPRQIQTLVAAADREAKSARATAMADPAVGPAIRQMESGGPGASKTNPVQPKTRAEAEALAPGTWFTDPAGNVIQRK